MDSIEVIELLTCDFMQYLDMLSKNNIDRSILVKDSEKEKSWTVWFKDGTEARVKVIVK